MGLSDLTVPADQFAGLSLPVARVFITENDVNGFAFPDMPESMVVFGQGYGGLDRLAGAGWLGDRAVHYWGDIDTHGFAILDRLRGYLPNVRSFLMDEETLTTHRELWGREDDRHTGPLGRLATAEQALFEALARDRFGDRVRLEQERIPFGWLERALRALAPGHGNPPRSSPSGSRSESAAPDRCIEGTRLGGSGV